MKDGKIFAMFFNASPRKGWNTAKMLVLGSPIYFSYPTGVYRAFFDSYRATRFKPANIHVPLKKRCENGRMRSEAHIR